MATGPDFCFVIWVQGLSYWGVPQAVFLTRKAEELRGQKLPLHPFSHFTKISGYQVEVLHRQPVTHIEV